MNPSDIQAESVAIDFDPFADVALARVVPMTEPQREIWLAAKLEPQASLAYNEAITLRFSGPLDTAVLQIALQKLVDRHEALRGTLSPDGEHFYIAEHVDLTCAIRDLSALDATTCEKNIAATLRRVVDTPFDLENGPLLRAELLHLADNDHLLVMTAHHVVCDGWSWSVIVRDLATLYASADAALPPADSFGDFAQSQSVLEDTEAHRADEAYWLSRFTGVVPSLDLPTDRPRPRRRNFASRREDRTLDTSLMTAVKRVGAQRGASLYAILLAAFGVLLQRLSGQDDVVIGIPSAGQAAGGHQALVGHCVNVLPLRAAIDSAVPFADLLAQVRGDLLDAVEHNQYTLGTLLRKLPIERDPGRLPLVSVLFNLDQSLDESSLRFPGLGFELRSVPRTFENFELFINAVQVDGALRLECQYNSDLFDAETVRAWLDAYEALLCSAIIAPAAAVGELAQISAQANAQLEAFQPVRTLYDVNQLAHEYFEAQADRAPERVAVCDANVRWSYGDLEAKANRIAHALRARGVRRGALVGLSLERGADMVAAVLGTLKAGAGYVPLDPAYPVERLAFMAEDAAFSAVVVSDGAPAGFEFPLGRILSLRRDAAVIAAAPPTRLGCDDSAAAPNSVVYAIYTSGSTGKPKGVLVSHRSASNFLTTMQHVPGIGADDRLVAVTTLSFDIAFMELMLPLSTGAQIVIAQRDDVRDGAALRKLVEQSGATMMQATPSGWRILVESGWEGHSGFRAVAGGEPLPVDLAEALLQRCGEVWNGYGPTEATVYSTYWRVDCPRKGIFIGRPVGNTTVRVLDERGALCPLGVPGELYIGGDGVALGYLNRPALDAERFLPDAFGVQPGARRYRTGDRGRWCANGQLEHLGRLDFQVKVRGYRIELGEIETNLAAHPDLARAAAVTREDHPGDVRLVAYVVARDGVTANELALRAYLKARLPDYMVPQHIVILDAIPLLPNGKIDRRALPAPQRHAERADERIAPRDERERRVAAVMEEVLALPELGIHDDFFALGGHSLLAAQLTARLNREFDVALSLRALFDAPTIAGLAAVIGKELDSGAAAKSKPIEHRVDQSRAPASLMQARLLFLEEMSPGRVTYNTPSAHRLRGRLDEDAFERAFAAMVQRQPVLRTAIRREGDHVMQIVEPIIELKLFPAEDLSTLPEDERESVLMQHLQELTDTPFDLTRAPLFSARMFRMGAEEHVLFFMPHHIIWDGWSFDLFSVEISELYRAFKTGRDPALPALPVSYGDFAVWHSQWLEGPQVQAQLAFWRERLAQAGEPSNLPTDKPRRPGMSGEGRTEWIRVSLEQTAAMHTVARNADATLNMALLALYYVLLYGTTGQRDLVIGTPVRGRHSTEVESVMGYFTNLVPLYLKLTPKSSFIDFVREVKRIVIDSFGNPDVPLEYLQHELKARYGGGALLYQALFSFQDARQRAVDWEGLAHEQILLFQRGATEDIGLWFLENNRGMIGGVTYNMDVLRADTARMLRERYLELLSRVVADPHQSLAALTQISDVDQAQIQRWNTAGGSTLGEARIDAMFEARANFGPAAPALLYGGWKTSYAELEQRANRFASCLRERGVSNGSIVVLIAESSINCVAALLGILKAGGTCVPLDPMEPASGLRAILDDANPAVIIGDSALEATLGWPRARALWFDADVAEIAAAPDTRVAITQADDSAPAFAFYAPDACGIPRAQAFAHHAIAQILDGLRRVLEIGDESRILGVAALDTAAYVLECLMALVSGGEFVLTGRDDISDGEISRLIAAGVATVVFATEDAWQEILRAGIPKEMRIKAVCIGGTPKPQLAERIITHCGELWNALTAGADVIVSCGRVESPAEGIHAGTPLAGNTVWVVGADDGPRPIGSAGEICLGGSCVGRDFCGRDAAAADPVMPAPWVGAGMHLARTGQRGRWLASGHIEELGRLDRRVRVGGRVIEPSEIEAALQAQPNVDSAIVIAREDRNRSVQLTAYVASKPGSRADVTALRAALQSSVHMGAIPRHIILLDKLPMLPGGDVNIAALPVPTENAGGGAASDERPPVGSLERAFLDIWCEMLQIPNIGLHENFFDLGGDSLMAVRVFQRVQELTGINLPLATLLQAPTLVGQAAAFRKAGAEVPVSLLVGGETVEDPWAPLVPIQRQGSRPPLFCMHGVGGNVLNYLPLARALGEDQPFYGLQAIGLDGLTRPLGSLAAMAERYVTEIRSVQPHGPYFLAGGSMGGMIAYEMARQLSAAGEQIALLALFDTFGPGNRLFEIERAGSIERFGYYWRDRWKRVRALEATERRSVLMNALRWRMQRMSDIARVRWSKLKGTALPHALRYRVIERSHVKAYFGYEPKPYAGRITLFRAAQRPPEMTVSRTLGWEKVGTEGIDVIDLPGRHATLIEQPELVTSLRAVLERAQADATVHDATD